MLSRFKIIQILGVALLVVSVLGGFYTQFANVSARFHVSELFWAGLMLLGLYARSAGEAGTLRERNSDKAATMSKQDLITSLVVSAILLGVVLWLGN